MKKPLVKHFKVPGRIFHLIVLDDGTTAEEFKKAVMKIPSGATLKKVNTYGDTTTSLSFEEKVGEEK